MSSTFLILTTIFIIVSVALILIILVQRPAGGGLAGAFGGAGGGGTESVFGGRVGDALTVMTVIGFCIYLGLAIALNLMDSRAATAAPPTTPEDILLPGSEDLPFNQPESNGNTDAAGLSPTDVFATPPANGEFVPAAPPADEGTFVPSPLPSDDQSD